MVVSLSTKFKLDEKHVIRFKKVSNNECKLLSLKRTHLCTLLIYLNMSTIILVTSTVVSKHQEKIDTEIFIRFEESLRKYLENSEHFTVEPKLAYVDVDLNLLNEFLLCDRPSTCLKIQLFFMIAPSTPCVKCLIVSHFYFFQLLVVTKWLAADMDFCVAMWPFCRAKLYDNLTMSFPNRRQHSALRLSQSRDSYSMRLPSPSSMIYKSVVSVIYRWNFHSIFKGLSYAHLKPFWRKFHTSL